LTPDDPSASPVPAESAAPPAPAAIVYVTDLAYDDFDPADLFDLAYLLCSRRHRVAGVCLTRDAGGDKIIDAVCLRSNVDLPPICDARSLPTLLAGEPAPVSVVVVGGYGAFDEMRRTQAEIMQSAVLRQFLVGGHSNNYGNDTLRLSIDPRLRRLMPERFAASGDPRVPLAEREAWARLLTCGDGVIWLPRDISLWRYAAADVLFEGGPLADLLCRELFYRHLQTGIDRYVAASKPVALSALPALLLAVEPDPFAWMRLFRVETARVETDGGAVSTVVTAGDRPNLYAVTAIDGAALGKLLTAGLRDRPLRLAE
jgi:hypothetical protein